MAGALGLPELVLIFVVILLLAAAEPLSRLSLPRPITRFIRRVVMRVVRPLAEFDAQGLRAGSIVIFDERTALALLGRAEKEYIAVAGIDQVSPGERHRYEPLGGRRLADLERLVSWRQARSFVEALSGRGLYFEVVLERPLRTHVAKLKYLFRTGTAWSARPGADGQTLQ